MSEVYQITGMLIVVLLCLIIIMFCINLSFSLVKKIRKIDFFWLLYMSCSYRNRKSKHDQLKDLIDTCKAQEGYFHNNSQDRGTAKSILKYLEKTCREALKDKGNE